MNCVTERDKCDYMRSPAQQTSSINALYNYFVSYQLLFHRSAFKMKAQLVLEYVTQTQKAELCLLESKVKLSLCFN
jgi:hypothetical protein